MVSAKELTTDFDLIKKILHQNPRGMTVTEVACTIRRTKNTVGRYLDILHASGQVEMRTFGMAKVYTLSQRIPLFQVFSHAEERVMILDKDLRILQINQPFLEIIGKKEEEVKGKNLLYLPLAEPGMQDLLSFIIHTLEEPGSSDVIPVHAHDDFFFKIKIIPIVFEDGSQGYTVILIDLTEVRKAMAALTESERKYRELVERANSIILKMDTQGNITFFNEFAERFFGFSKEEILGKNVLGTIVPPTESSGRDLKKMIHEICTMAEEHQNNENENITRDGRRVWIRWTNSPIRDEQGRPVGALSVGTDISERKRMEEALQKERDLITTTLHAIDALVVVLNRDGRVIRFNHACETLSGFTEDEVLGRSFAEFLLPEERKSVMAVFQDLLSGKSSKGYRNHWINRNGEPKLIEWSNSTVSDLNDQVTHVIATGIDLTRYQKVEPFKEN